MRQTIKTGIIFLVGFTTELYYIKVFRQSFGKVWIAEKIFLVKGEPRRQTGEGFKIRKSPVPMDIGTPPLQGGLGEIKIFGTYGKISVMKKKVWLWSVAFGAVIVLTIALLTLRVGIKTQNPLPISKSVQTQISESENFLEKIGASGDSNITSILERGNPLEVFETVRQQTVKTETNANSNSKPESVSPSSSFLPNQNEIVPPAIPADFNTQNVGDMISAVWKVGREQGFTEERLVLIEKEVRSAVAATSTNYMELFISEMNKIGQPVSKAENPIVSFLVKLLAPKAYAQSGGQNFGGMVLFPFFCPCSGNWLVAMMPYPPSTIALITHYMGAQMFLNYNFPFSRFVLGKYTSGGAPCLIYVVYGCITLPSQGMTTPMIGTSGV